MTKRCRLRLINICGDVLSDLFIGLEYCHHKDIPRVSNISADIFIRHCSNLIRFTFSGALTNPTEYKPALDDVKHKHLNYLGLCITNIDGNLDLTPFLKAIAKLKHLGVVLPCIAKTGDSLPSLLVEFCPELVSLVFTTDSSLSKAHHKGPVQYRNNSNNYNSNDGGDSLGVVDLTWHDTYPDDDSPYNYEALVGQLIPLLHSKLQIFDIGGCSAVYGYSTMENLPRY